MQTIINDLITVPGVIGLYLFNSTEGVTANSMPPLFSDNELAQIGRVMAKIHTTCCQNVAGVEETAITYEEAEFIVRSAVDNIFLIVMFEPSMAQDLLTMSLNMAIDDLRKIIREQELAPELPIAAAMQDETAPPEKEARLSAEELLARGSGPLREKLLMMKSELIKVMGPMAKIVFVDALYLWMSNGSPSMAALPSLADILGKELGDPAKAIEYKKLVAPYIKSAA